MTANGRTNLKQFLNASINSKTRERIFFNRLYFDIKLAAARRGYSLTVFEPEVDREGFDVVLDDADTRRHLQLKSATISARTKRWTTTPRFLRPELREMEPMFFESSPQGEGLGGGVILILIDDATDVCPVRYFFTDLYIIAALSAGLLVQVGKSGNAVKQLRRDQAKRVLHQLYEKCDHNAELVLPLAVFLEVKSPDCLLAIAGLHSVEQGGQQWSPNLAAAYSKNFEADDSGQPDASLDRQIIASAHAAGSGLLTLVNEPKFLLFQSGIRDML
jgi:hypothetical protein